MTEPPVEEKPVETASAPSGRGQKLWAVLLVLDSFFVITFGGTLAMKLYQHWQAPPPVVPSRAHRPPKAAAPPAASTDTASAPAPAPAAPAKAAPAKAEPAKPAAKAEPAPSNGMRPPKPSMLQEAPRHEKAGLQGAGAPSAPAAAAPSAPAAAGAKNKALPTEFSLKAPGARSVELVGAFIVHGGRKAMVSHPDGTWTLTLYLTPNTYRYWFVVNGKKTLDPSSARVDRGASVVTVGQ